MKTITFTEFRKNASGLFNEVENGETLIIMRHGKAIAEIAPHVNELRTPAWKQSGIKLKAKGKSLSKMILEEREAK